MSFASKISNYCLKYLTGLRTLHMVHMGMEYWGKSGPRALELYDYDYINTRCIDLVKSLKLQTICETIFCVFWCSNVYMALHLATCPMMLLWSSISMVTMQGVPKIWIYTYQDVQKNFINVVSYTKAVCCGMDCPISWKNPACVMYLKAIIISSLLDKSLSIYGYIYP